MTFKAQKKFKKKLLSVKIRQNILSISLAFLFTNFNTANLFYNILIPKDLITENPKLSITDCVDKITNR